jgi:hypothetical protein
MVYRQALKHGEFRLPNVAVCNQRQCHDAGSGLRTVLGVLAHVSSFFKRGCEWFQLAIESIVGGR